MNLIKYLFSFLLFLSFLFPSERPQSRYDLIHNYKHLTSSKIPEVYKNYFPKEKAEAKNAPVSQKIIPEEAQPLSENKNPHPLKQNKKENINDIDPIQRDEIKAENDILEEDTYFGARYYDSFTGRRISRD